MQVIRTEHIVNSLIDSFCIFARAPDKGGWGGGVCVCGGGTDLISQLNIYCDPSLEPSHQDSSNEGSQYMFLMENMANYPKIMPVTSSYLEL